MIRVIRTTWSFPRPRTARLSYTDFAPQTLRIHGPPHLFKHMLTLWQHNLYLIDAFWSLRILQQHEQHEHRHMAQQQHTVALGPRSIGAGGSRKGISSGYLALKYDPAKQSEVYWKHTNTIHPESVPYNTSCEKTFKASLHVLNVQSVMAIIKMKKKEIMLRIRFTFGNARTQPPRQVLKPPCILSQSSPYTLKGFRKFGKCQRFGKCKIL